MLIDELTLYLYVMNGNFIPIQCWLVEEEIDLWITIHSLGKMKYKCLHMTYFLFFTIEEANIKMKSM
jgi:hypothetical protein